MSASRFWPRSVAQSYALSACRLLALSCHSARCKKATTALVPFDTGSNVMTAFKDAAIRFMIGMPKPVSRIG